MAAVILALWLKDTGLPLVNDQRMPLPKENEIRVVFMDVGQGDAVLIHDPQHAVLIDAGEYSESEAVLSGLRSAGVGALDLAVATHPHSDHIGAMAAVLAEVPARRVWMPNAVSDTAAFERLLALLEETDTPVETPRLGETFTAGSVELVALAPFNTPGEWTDGDDLNNASLVLRMVYGDTGFLFTGDAEASSELEMLDGGHNLRASVLKVGHHGSGTSTTDAWLDAVDPRAAVISCGAGNSYGHPNAETLERLNARGIQTYRTDESGTVAMVTDGKDVYIYAQEMP